ncbi:hypothetical protein OSB04_015327 [Centaurea solstitialis]|uniref:C3H1-type domain-containing protein n=1 Tax=Centaurea solstitialis TaxID=347529 RepID=A0AA38W8U3_9ASTR|nr:hypothetical protein OSB04_015327 [Centaurea solstitialis]
MPPTEKPVIGTLENVSVPSTGTRRRRGPLRSRTVDIFLRILSACHEFSANNNNNNNNLDSGIMLCANSYASHLTCYLFWLNANRTLQLMKIRMALLLRTTLLRNTHIESVTKDDVPLADNNVMPNESLCQGEVSADETRMALGTQEGGVFSKHVESTECYDNVSGERKDLSDIVDTIPSDSFTIEDQDNYDIDFGAEDSFPIIPNFDDMMISPPHLPTDKDVEEGEISGEFMDLMLDNDMSSMDKTGSEPQDGVVIEPAKDNNLIPLATDMVHNVGKDTVVVASKTRRNLVDYSEIAVDGKSIQAVNPEKLYGRLETSESAKHGTAAMESGRALIFPEDVTPLQSNLKNNGTKNQDRVSPVKSFAVSPCFTLAYTSPLTGNKVSQDNAAQNNKKRQGSCTREERKKKKVKTSVDATTCPENLTMLGENSEDDSQEDVDASANKDATDEKKKKRVLTKERKARKKRKERIKRAEKNRKLGVKRLKLQPVIKEKKITFCRHYLQGRCHEGEKCKFSHDTIPLTKSKPCCHFARHACMKGDDCPFDHQLSKYPCINYISKGFCSRGSDCMFSHEAQPSESTLNVPKESKPEPKPSSILNNSGSKKQNNVDVSSREKIDKKSCSIPISVTSKTERNLVAPTTPKTPAQPPKGISFLSQKKPPQESRTTPKVVPAVVQDSKEITKTPLVVPRGINFLSFGKKPGLDSSDCGFSFKMGKGIGKSPLSNVEGEISKYDSTVNVGDGVKVDAKIGNDNDKQTDFQRPKLMLPFMSSSSQRVLNSTLDFASNFVSGVKAKGPEV